MSTGPTTRPAPPRRRRHCWVTHPEHPGEELEGLLLAWAKDEQGWVALVIFVVPRSGEHGPVAVQEWIPASRLHPAAP